MKQYGVMKATEFTKKQINVIYFKAKNGELKVEKWFINKLYELADFYGYDDNGTVAYDEIFVKKIIDSAFNGTSEKTQELINDCENKWFEQYGKKEKQKCDRMTFVC